MGGAPSKKAVKKANRDRESLRTGMAKSVEKFVINVYATCPRLEAMQLILESKRGYLAFQNFLNSEKASEIIQLHYEIATLVERKELQLQELHEAYINIIAKYIFQDSAEQVVLKSVLRDEAILIANMKTDDAELSKRLNAVMPLLVEEIVKMMARDQFFRFIQSRHYKKWRSVESSHAMAHTIEDAIGVDLREKSDEEMKKLNTTVAASETVRNKSGSDKQLRGQLQEIKTVRKKSIRQPAAAVSQRIGGRSIRKRGSTHEVESFSIRPRNRSPEVSISSRNFAVSAFENVDTQVIESILSAKSWLSCLLPAVEALPICFTLSVARKNNKSFPFVFVNQYFEKVTGFQSAEILGKNASFLLCPLSEKTEVQALNDAMKGAKRITKCITTRTSDGRMYKNMFSTRPVFTELKVLKYVIILYMDVSKETDDYVSKTALMNDLTEMIPDTILSDGIEEEDYLDEEDGDAFNISCIPGKKENDKAVFMDNRLI